MWHCATFNDFAWYNMPHNLKVMSVLNLYPQKLGSFEEYTLLLSQHLAYPGSQSILVFDRPPPGGTSTFLHCCGGSAGIQAF